MSVCFMRLLAFFPPFDLHWFIMAARFGELNLERALQQWWEGGWLNTFKKPPPVFALTLALSLTPLIST